MPVNFYYIICMLVEQQRLFIYDMMQKHQMEIPAASVERLKLLQEMWAT